MTELSWGFEGHQAPFKKSTHGTFGSARNLGLIAFGCLGDFDHGAFFVATKRQVRRSNLGKNKKLQVLWFGTPPKPCCFSRVITYNSTFLGLK